MVASPQGQHDMSSEPTDDGFHYGYRRHFPFWLIFPLMFLLFRAPFFWGWGYGWYGPGAAFMPMVMAVVMLAVIGVLLLRFAAPALDQAVRPRFRRQSARAESEGESTQRLDLELIDAHRRIKALEEQVAWQSKLLATQTPAPAVMASAAAPETSAAPRTATNASPDAP